MEIEGFMESLKCEAKRLRTFQLNPAWPLEFIDPRQLARAGFFYYLIEDRVQCAFCRGIIDRWERGDDPLAEHARLFTRCPFIMGADVGNVPISDDPIPGPKRRVPYVSKLNSPTIQSQNQQSSHYMPPPLTNSPSTATAMGLTTTNHLSNQRNSNNTQLGICKICYSNEVAFTFIPCGHGVVCLSCASYLNNCPMCRAPVQQRIRLFLA